MIKSRNQYVIVLRSGTENLGKWVWEEVNAYEDYRRLFGGDPRPSDLVGLLTDSNNTKSFVKADYDDDDMKVNRDAEGRLHQIGKRLLPPDTNAESIGMLAFTGDGPSIFRNQVDQMMRTPDGVERWYLRAIDIIAKGNRVGTVSIEGLEWQEVDFPQDVEAADALTAKWAAAGLYAK